jgi:hypothetical protein
MTTAKPGLDALLTPQNSVLLLIDHQPFQLFCQCSPQVMLGFDRRKNNTP